VANSFAEHRIAKWREYQRILSLRHFVVIAILLATVALVR
jgi:hypothetical protein